MPLFLKGAVFVEEGCKARLQMIGSFLEGEKLDVTEYPCEVLRYEKDRERIYLILKEGDITRISLDAEYNCLILGDEELSCQGRVLERFIDKRGSQLVFDIENGFYKNNLN